METIEKVINNIVDNDEYSLDQIIEMYNKRKEEKENNEALKRKTQIKVAARAVGEAMMEYINLVAPGSIEDREEFLQFHDERLQELEKHMEMVNRLKSLSKRVNAYTASATKEKEEVDNNGNEEDLRQMIHRLGLV